MKVQPLGFDYDSEESKQIMKWISQVDSMIGYWKIQEDTTYRPACIAPNPYIFKYDGTYLTANCCRSFRLSYLYLIISPN